jgi:hypothetical protein
MDPERSLAALMIAWAFGHLISNLAPEPGEVNLGALRAALEAAGIEFIAEKGGRASVRLRKGGE